jgi:nitroimidazol reductase NimA-like FMN-containing flavoprotein (pyridoxamine 5'-phosphate oxidase superfamily)
MNASMAESGAFAAVPLAERPRTPGVDYGVPLEGGELIEWSFVAERLAAASDYWVATIAADGHPHVMPIWGVFVADDLFLETSPATKKARNLARDPAVTVHLDDAQQAVIVEGSAKPFRPTGELSGRIAAAFAAKYRGYRPTPDSWDRGGLYRVEPAVVFAWRDMPSATRWRFQEIPHR